MATNTSVSVGATTTKVLDANGGRELVILQNDSNEDIYIAFGEAAVLNKGLLLSTASKTILPLKQMVDKSIMQSQINAICASGTKNLLVIHA